MINCVIDGIVNAVKDWFVIDKDGKVFKDLLNPLKPFNLDENLTGLINDDLTPKKPKVFDPLDNGVSGSIPCLPSAPSLF